MVTREILDHVGCRFNPLKLPGRSPPLRLFHFYPDGHHKARHHIVAGDGPRQLYNLLVRQYGAHPLHGGVRHGDVARHLVGQRQCGALRFIEQPGVVKGGRHICQRVQLLLGTAGLQELRLMLPIFIVGLVEHSDRHNGHLPQLGCQRQLVADGRKHKIPPPRKGWAVQQYAVEV